MKEIELLPLTETERKKKNSWKKRLRRVFEKCLPFFFNLMTGILVWISLYGKKAGTPVMTLLVILQVIFWVFLHINRNEDRIFRRKRLRFSVRQGIYAGISLALIFFIALTVVWYRPVSFYDMAYRAEEFAVNTLRKFTGTTGNPISGNINRGNNYRTGEVQLEVTVSEMPAQTLYLKGFSGGEYAGNRWEAADEEKVFDEVCRILDWEAWRSMIDGMYYSMYFLLNQNTVREEPPSSRAIYIRHENGERTDKYVPYHSVRGMGKWWDENGEEDGYGYRYYEQKEMAITWDRIAGSMGNGTEWYRYLQDAYGEAAQNAYTGVPRELLPELTRFAEINPQEGLDEISSFILYQLQNRAAYTLTPGWAPIHKDIAEYFFFESGQGYCQHFAVAAVLLYRLYGIPARYAAGYAVQPSDFQRQEDGNWKAEVTDESAHAWAEILLEDYGWVPVEVTTGADGTISASYPGFDSDVRERITERLRQDSGSRKLAETGKSRNEGEAEAGYSIIFDFQKYKEKYLYLGFLLLYTLLLVPFFFDYRRLRCRQKMESMGSRKVFAVMTDMLHYAGYFRELQGWEPEFPGKVSEKFPQITEKEMCRVLDIVKEAAYGPAPLEEEKEQFVRWIYFRLGEQIYRRINGYRKLVFRYFKGYG